MRWYEYKMETDDLYAPDDLKAKLLAMTDQLTEEEKAQPMMKTAAPVPNNRPPGCCSLHQGRFVRWQKHHSLPRTQQGRPPVRPPALLRR